MRLVDATGLALGLFAVVAFYVGEVFLSRAEDLLALYWTCLAVLGMRASLASVRDGGPP